MNREEMLVAWGAETNSWNSFLAAVQSPDWLKQQPDRKVVGKMLSAGFEEHKRKMDAIWQERWNDGNPVSD